jgi:hypothetical protein
MTSSINHCRKRSKSSSSKQRGSKRRKGQIIFTASHFFRSGWLKVGNNENRGTSGRWQMLGTGFRTVAIEVYIYVGCLFRVKIPLPQFANPQIPPKIYGPKITNPQIAIFAQGPQI